MRERAGVEAGHGADTVAGEGEDEQPSRVEDPGPRILGVQAERGLAVGRVGTIRDLRPGRSPVAARNLATSSRPWYSSDSGGMVTAMSSVSRATTAATSPAW